MLAESALVEVQLRVEDSPARTVSGLADILTVGCGWVTVTVTESVAVPPEPVAVMV